MAIIYLTSSAGPLGAAPPTRALGWPSILLSSRDISKQDSEGRKSAYTLGLAAALGSRIPTRNKPRLACRRHVALETLSASRWPANHHAGG